MHKKWLHISCVYMHVHNSQYIAIQARLQDYNIYSCFCLMCKLHVVVAAHLAPKM